MDKLKKALRYFDGESGLDNSQVQYFLRKSFKCGDLSKKEILIDLCHALSIDNFDWKGFISEINLINDLEPLTNQDIKDYILDLVCDLIFTIDVNQKDSNYPA